jgi:hypothetical protein
MAFGRTSQEGLQVRKHLRTLAALVAGIAAAALAPVGIASGAAGIATVSAKLTGSAEVPPVASSASGTVRVTLDPNTGKACWTFSTKKLSGALTANILRGTPGKTGPSVIRLGAKFSPKGCTGASKSAISAVVSKPGAYYVNVQTTNHLNGALRGQLSK